LGITLQVGRQAGYDPPAYLGIVCIDDVYLLAENVTL
jgi:hypothetical protein